VRDHEDALSEEKLIEKVEEAKGKPGRKGVASRATPARVLLSCPAGGSGALKFFEAERKLELELKGVPLDVLKTLYDEVGKMVQARLDAVQQCAVPAGPPAQAVAPCRAAGPPHGTTRPSAAFRLEASLCRRLGHAATCARPLDGALSAGRTQGVLLCAGRRAVFRAGTKARSSTIPLLASPVPQRKRCSFMCTGMGKDGRARDSAADGVLLCTPR